MPTYYYPFDLTSTTRSFAGTDTVPSSGWDISEFANDSRGTPKVADWSHIKSFDASEFDAFAEVLGFTESVGIGWTSYSSDPIRPSDSGNKYYRDLSGNNRAYYSRISIDNDSSSNSGFTVQTITTSPLRAFKIGSWYFPNGLKVLVYFPDYEANGGHSTLVVNNTTTTWDSTNERFASSDNNTLLRHDGSTWIIDQNGNTSSASYDSTDVPDYIDPASSDLTWQNDSSVELASAGAIGDPHIRTFDGFKYTL